MEEDGLGNGEAVPTLAPCRPMALMNEQATEGTGEVTAHG